MTFDPQKIFADLSEKERVHGHHSPEGQAIRALSRALDGWLSENLSGADVVVLCGQATEDWLKARLGISAWSAIGRPELLARAVEDNLVTRPEAVRLRRIHDLRAGLRDGTVVAGIADVAVVAIIAADVMAALECSIQIVEARWS